MAHREQAKPGVPEDVERPRPIIEERTSFRRSERIVMVALAEAGRIGSGELLARVRGTSEGSALIALNRLEKCGLVESTWSIPDPTKVTTRRRANPEPQRLCSLSDRGRKAVVAFGVRATRGRRRS